MTEAKPGRAGGRASWEARLRRSAASPYAAYAALTAAMFCWACSTVVARGVHETTPPIGLSFWRTLLGAAIVLPFVWTPLLRQLPLVRRHIGIVLALSFLLIVGGNAILFFSLQFTIAINAGVLNSFEPVLILIVAWAVYRDRVTAFQALGVGVSLLGVFAVIGRGDPGVLLELDFNKGDLLILGAFTSWAFYAVYLRKIPRGLDSRVMLFLLLFLGALLLLPFYVVETVFDRPIRPDGPTLVSIVGLALFASVMAIFLWNYGIRRLGAGRASIFIHLIVVFTVLLAVLFLDESFAWYHGLGVGLIFCGIYFSEFHDRAVR